MPCDSEQVHIMTECDNTSHERINDTGATSHMCGDKGIMQDLKPNACEVHVRTMGETLYVSKLHGSVDLRVKAGNRIQPVKLTGVLLLERATRNLLSVSALEERGYIFNFTQRGCKVLHETSELLVATGTKKGGLYFLDLPNGGKSRRASASLGEDCQLCGRRQAKGEHHGYVAPTFRSHW